MEEISVTIKGSTDNALHTYNEVHQGIEQVDEGERMTELLTMGRALVPQDIITRAYIAELAMLPQGEQLGAFLRTRLQYIFEHVIENYRGRYVDSLHNLGVALFGEEFQITEYALEVFRNALRPGGAEGLAVLSEATVILASHGGQLGHQLFGNLVEGHTHLTRSIAVIAMIPTMNRAILERGLIPQYQASRETSQYRGARDIFAISMQRRALKLATGAWQQVTQTIEIARLTLEGDQQMPRVDLNQILAEPTMEFELPHDDSPKLIDSPGPERVLTQEGNITLTGADIGAYDTKRTLHMDGPAGSHAFLSMHTIMPGNDEHEDYYEHPPQDAGTIITLPDGNVAMLVVDGASLGESAVVSKRIIELFTEMIPTAGNLLGEANMRALITRVEAALVQWQIATDNRMGFATLQFLIVNPETRAMLYATVAGARGTEGNLNRDEGHLVMQQKMRKPIDIQLARYPWQTFMGVRADPLHAEHQIHIEISAQRTIPDNVVAIGIGCDGLTAQQTEEALKKQEVGTRKAPADDRTVAGLILQK